MGRWASNGVGKHGDEGVRRVGERRSERGARCARNAVGEHLVGCKGGVSSALAYLQSSRQELSQGSKLYKTSNKTARYQELNLIK